MNNFLNKKKDLKDLKNFWIIFSLIFFLIFAYKIFLTWKNFSEIFSKNFLENNLNIFYFFYLSLIFLLSSLIFPKILFPLYKIWMKFSDILWFINTKIIIWFLFFCVFTPMWIIWKIFWKKFLEKKIDKNKKSYFEKCDSEKNNFNEQF